MPSIALLTVSLSVLSILVLTLSLVSKRFNNSSPYYIIMIILSAVLFSLLLQFPGLFAHVVGWLWAIIAIANTVFLVKKTYRQLN